MLSYSVNSGWQLTGQLLMLGVSAVCLFKFLFLLILMNKTLYHIFGFENTSF